jgi:hypothetical protein
MLYCYSICRVQCWQQQQKIQQKIAASSSLTCQDRRESSQHECCCSEHALHPRALTNRDQEEHYGPKDEHEDQADAVLRVCHEQDHMSRSVSFCSSSCTKGFTCMQQVVEQCNIIRADMKHCSCCHTQKWHQTALQEQSNVNSSTSNT